MNKQAYNWTNFWIYESSLCIFIMVILKLAESWSQNHGTPNEPFLHWALMGIIITFVIRSFAHNESGRGLFRLNMFGINWVRNKHLNATTVFLFAGVLAFGVNSATPWVQTAHLVFTGLAIASVYLNMIFYFESKVGKALSIIGLILGGGIFVTSFWLDHTIAEGEAAAAVPIIIWIKLTSKLK